jgi:hypothetical protein
MFKTLIILMCIPFAGAAAFAGAARGGVGCDSLPPSVRDSIVQVLFIVDDSDQYYRLQLEELRQSKKSDSLLAKGLMEKAKAADSIDLVKVLAIVAKYGWLGPNDVGDQCSSAMFMVVQHAGLPTQQKYLPMLREAEAKGKLRARHLALLEDRVAVLTHHKQLYGTQIYWDTRTSSYFLAPLEDPDHVDERRIGMGMTELKDYLSGFGVVWDLDAYKKRLPADMEFLKTVK